MDERALIDLVKLEVVELLGAGRVGLYEFADVLRSRDLDLDGTEPVPVCRAALAELRSERRVRLVWQRWTDLDFCADASDVTPPPEAWQPPHSDPFLAVIAVDDE